MSRWNIKFKGGGISYYNEISIARGIGIILVVLGHAFPDSSSGVSGNISKVIFEIIYSFHMPLFFFIAGFVAVKMFHINNKGEYILNRSKRLLVPYVVSAFLYLPLKIAMSKYANRQYDLKELWKIVIGENPNYAMWTLWSLFFAAFIAILFVNKKNIVLLTAGGILIGIIFSYVSMNAVGPQMLFVNIGYYFMGLLISVNYEKVKGIILEKNITIYLSIMMFILFNYIKQYMECYRIETVPIVFTAISGIATVLTLSLKLISKVPSSIFAKVLSCCGSYSMDIYILSTFVQPVLRIVFWSKLRLNYGVYTVFSTIAGVVFPIIISRYIFRKFSVTRKLLLGMK